jgi:hypothetical protein
MATHSGFRWDASKFENPEKMEDKLRRALFGVVRYWDGPIEAHIKTSAPWTDRTTNARSGLAATAVKESDDVYSIIMTYSVDYGIYLERANDGKYATIIPALTSQAPRVLKTCTKLMDRLGTA